MATDPWSWSVANVQQFFQQDAIGCIADRPSGQLPDLDVFIQAIGDNDLDGASLLDTIDMGLLLSEFGIKSMRQRSSIMHCIAKLKLRSQACRSRDRSLGAHSPTYLPTPRLMPADIAGFASILPSTEAVGENVRRGEVQVEDSQGRKRRKLNPVVVQIAQPKTPRQDLTSHLPDDALPIDSVFYGPTAFGRVVGELAPDGDVLFDPHNPDTAEDNFQFTNEHKRVGETHFVYSHMFHYLANVEEISVRRRDKDALAILPYRENVQHQARSATVIQVSERDGYVAVREQASLLQSGHDYSGMDQSSNGEWDWLLLQHQQKEGEEEVSIAGGESDNEMGEALTTASSDENKGPEAEEDDEEQVFDKLRVAEVVDTEIEKCIAAWHEKVPQLEEKRAWTVWRKMKHSRTLRDVLIEGANGRIANFTRRLAKLREDLLDREFNNEAGVQRACLNLEPTVEDREAERWNVSVWLQKREPQHTVQHHAKQTATTLQTPHTAKASNPGFAVHPDDRMSVSPTPAIHADADTGADDDGTEAVPAEEGSEKFHTPNGTPEPLLATDGDGFEASDEMSMIQYSDEQEPSSDVVEGDELMDQIMSSPPGRDIADTSPADVPEEGVADEPQTPAGEWRCENCNTSMVSDDLTVNQHLDECASTAIIKEMEDASSDNEDLPDVSTFLSQKSKSEPKSPTSERHSALPSTQRVEITISSDSPDPTSSPRPKKKRAISQKKTIVYSSNPDGATAAEVDSWDVVELKKRDDRIRMLIKCLGEMSPQQREDLHGCLLALGSPKNQVEQLRAAIKTRETGEAEDAGLNSEYAEMMLLCATLAMTYLMCDHQCFVKPDDVKMPWPVLYEDLNQISIFLVKLLGFLRMKHSKLFKDPSARKSGDKVKHPGVTIIASDSDVVSHTPHKVRKNKIAESQSARKMRNVAQARMERYEQRMVESQTSDLSRLLPMVPSDPSNLEIAVNLASLEDHPDYDPIFIHPMIAKDIKPHQVEGVRFMWREVTSMDEDDRQGCLLAHTMGLGKTLQTITLLVAVVEAAASSEAAVNKQLPAHLLSKSVRSGKRQHRILILCPPSLLQNWYAEIMQWAPTAIGKVFIIDGTSSKPQQFNLIADWHRLGGVLLIGYEMFRGFVIRKEDKYADEDGAKLDKMLLKGPAIVVADEAHKLKDMTSITSRSASAVNTHTRIALTGTPMSNDVQEIYALVSWVAPGFLGEPVEFRANFAEPIAQGMYSDSTRYEQRKMLKKLAVLHDRIKSKVHRADITVLRGSLKPKVEFVITVPLTEMQTAVYRRYVEALLGGGRNEEAGQTQIFNWLAVLGLLTNHPSAFRTKLLTKPVPKKGKKAAHREATPSGAESSVERETVAAMEQPADADAEAGESAFGDPDVYSLGFTEAMVHAVLGDLEASHTSPTLSAKTSILLDIVQLSHDCGDKLLIFSTSIPTLQYISEQFRQRNIHFGRIDGTVPMPKRVQLLEDFHSDKFEVMVVSTRAGGVGLNIQGANRVVIMDFGFNPAWEEQAIGRAYRLGQLKPVFVYRFLAGGTFESNLWNKQLFKTSLTNRVVDKKSTKRNAQRNTREYLHDPTEVPQDDLSQWVGKDPMVLDRILARQDVADSSSMIRTILTTETLQEIVQDEPLNEEEQRELAEEIQQDKARVRDRRATQIGALAVKGGSTPVQPLAATQQFPVPRRRPSGQVLPPVAYVPPSATAPEIGRTMGGLPWNVYNGTT